MNYTCTIIIALFVFSCQSKNDNEVSISAKNKNIHYIGRIDSTENFVEYAYSGVGIVFNLVGKNCQLEFSDENFEGEQHKNYLAIEINHKLDSVLEIQKGKNTYDISSLLKNDTNHIAIYKRTEASVGSLNFHGIRTKTASFLIPVELPKRKILWIGNSITCGYGNDLSIEAPPKGNPRTGFHSKNENNYLAWGSLTSRKLNAQSHQICYSGIGMFRNYDKSTNNTMPKVYDKIMPDDQRNAIWNHQNFNPDLIIINLGTNDFAAEGQNSPNFLDSAQFVNSYILFVKHLVSLHPNAKIITVVGNMLSDNSPTNFKRLSRNRRYVQAVVANFEKNHPVYFFELPTQKAPFGENWHPSLKTHQEMSELILPLIRKITLWE